MIHFTTEQKQKCVKLSSTTTTAAARGDVAASPTANSRSFIPVLCVGPGQSSHRSIVLIFEQIRKIYLIIKLIM